VFRFDAAIDGDEVFRGLVPARLTHPEAADEVRRAMTAYHSRLADAIPAGDDALLRTCLINAITFGVVIARHLHCLADVADVSP
jgi:Tetracyclin repressor-like, C-terminal domain